jgi:hypothetical protein
LAAFIPVDSLGEVHGTAQLEHVRGTFRPGQGVPADLSIQGSVKAGRLAVATATWQDMLDPIDIKFQAQPGSIHTSVWAESPKLGPLFADGQYRMAQRGWEGRVSCDVAGLNIFLPKEGWSAEAGPGLLASYGSSQFDLTMNLPSPSSQILAFRFARAAPPRLGGTVTFVPVPDGWALGDLMLKLDAPLAAFGPAIPLDWKVDGLADVAVTRPLERRRFVVRADLTACSVGVGDYLRKRPGDSAILEVEGRADAETWAGESVTLNCLDQTLQGRLEEPRFVVDSLDLALAPWARLLPDGATAGGRVTGSIRTAPTELNLQLDQVAAVLSPELAIDSVSGRVAYRQEQWDCTGLRVRAANSDCVLTVRNRRNNWEGSLTGRQLDLTRMTELIRAAQALQPSAEPEEIQPTPAQPAADAPTGQFKVDLETLLYRHARMSAVRTDVVLSEGMVNFENLTLQPESGLMKGTAALAAATPDRAGAFAADVELTGADMKFVDGIAFETPRGLKGTLNGTIDLLLPVNNESSSYRGAFGKFEFVSTDGTLGTLGLATKLLTVLRATEITRLKLPTLRDEGLVYDTCTGTADLVDGLLTVGEVKIKSPSYEINVTGTVDLVQWQCKLLIDFNPLQTVTGVAENVPIVGEAVGTIGKLGTVTFLATGPPDDPKITVVPPASVGNITGEVRDAAKTGEDLVVDGLKGLAADALRNILKR